MRAEAFFNTNVLIYAVAENDPRAARAEELLLSGGVVSVQVLNEFTAVARRKLQMPWAEVGGSGGGFPGALSFADFDHTGDSWSCADDRGEAWVQHL